MPEDNDDSPLTPRAVNDGDEDIQLSNDEITDEPWYDDRGPPFLAAGPSKTNPTASEFVRTIGNSLRHFEAICVGGACVGVIITWSFAAKSADTDTTFYTILLDRACPYKLLDVVRSQKWLAHDREGIYTRERCFESQEYIKTIKKAIDISPPLT